MSNFLYSSFGLNISSEFELVGLAPGPPGADVYFRIGQPAAPPHESEIEFVCEVDSRQCRFYVDGVARFVVSNGNDVLIQPFARMDPDAMRLFLLSTGIGALLHQRLVLAIHGSAVVTTAGAIIFAGMSGAGKSTLAAAFGRQGYPVLCDEISAIHISEMPLVMPGPNWILLWQDSLHKLGLTPDTLSPVRRELRKFYFPLSPAQTSAAVPLKKIYIVESTNRSGFELIPLRGLRKFSALSSILYRVDISNKMGLAATYFPQISGLASLTEIVQLKRPRDFRLDELREILERDLE